MVMLHTLASFHWPKFHTNLVNYGQVLVNAYLARIIGYHPILMRFVAGFKYFRNVWAYPQFFKQYRQLVAYFRARQVAHY